MKRSGAWYKVASLPRKDVSTADLQFHPMHAGPLQLSMLVKDSKACQETFS